MVLSEPQKDVITSLQNGCTLRTEFSVPYLFKQYGKREISYKTISILENAGILTTDKSDKKVLYFHLTDTGKMINTKRGIELPIVLSEKLKMLIAMMRAGATLVEYTFTGQEWCLRTSGGGKSIDLHKQEDIDAVNQLFNYNLAMHNGVCGGKTAYYILTELGETVKLN